ncbi:hypothetical protein [Lysobacter gummosus]|uniref:hypothetical protein n=1 Tax=Lysobacter gummosus TaxID=262324 RepID=UPI00363779FA
MSPDRRTKTPRTPNFAPAAAQNPSPFRGLGARMLRRNTSRQASQRFDGTGPHR